MYRNKKLLYTTFAILSFLFCFAFLQTIQLGGERVPLSLTVYGRNLEGIKAHYNNKITRNTPLDIDSSSSKYCSLTIPEYAFVRSFVLALNYNDSLEIHKIELQGNSNKITINAVDIPNYFRCNDFVYNKKSKQFTPRNKIENKNNIINLHSIDTSHLFSKIYTKRMVFKDNLLFSTIISILSTIMLYYLFHVRLKNSQIIIIQISMAIVLSFSYQILNKKETLNKFYDDEENALDLIKPPANNNLIYNGDFKFGLMFWGYNSDSTTQEIIDTQYGKAIRIIRGNGNEGYFSLLYRGRRIVYYANHEYVIRFKFKNLKNINKIPFKIGWWTPNGSKDYLKAHSLKIDLTYIENGWFQGECKYTFQENYYDLPCILNSLQDFSDIIITDINITDVTAVEDQINYVDQINSN